MSFINVISAIGNNNSLYPLLVRDCGIEIPTKVAMTYNQNKSDKYIAKLAVRERLTDEYSVSAVWLGGGLSIGWCADKIIRKFGFNPDISTKLFKEEAFQGLEYNINKFRDKAPEVVAELEKAKNNMGKYKNLLAAKFLAQTVIPIALMGWVIPKLVFAWTAKTKALREQAIMQDKFESENKENVEKAPAFKGLGSLAELSNVQKLFITDAGYAVGRVATARKRNEAYDIAVKMLGMMYLNFIFPKQLEKLLNSASAELLKTNLDLDIKMLADKKFLELIKNGTFELPKSDKAKDLIEFIDSKPSAKFTEYANKYGKVKMLNEKIRDPRAYVDFEALGKFRNSIENFGKMAKNAEGADIIQKVENYARKACGVKAATIIMNVLITSGLLAIGLPKFQFLMRELITGSKLEPGIVD